MWAAPPRRRFYQSAKFLKGIKGPFTLTVNEFAAISTNELENPKTGDLIYGEQGDDIPDGYERLYETVQVLALFEDLKVRAPCGRAESLPGTLAGQTRPMGE